MFQGKNGKRFAFALGAAGLLAANAGMAADAPKSAVTAELEEVVVTAERREVDLQKTALSVTAISADQVQKTGISTYENLLESIPGVQVQVATGPVTQPYIAIRGLGTDGDNKPGATAVYLDGVVLGPWGGQLYDLQRVEVLRGPQGTLYGGVATGGALNIVSNNPSLDGYAGSGQLEIGNYSLVHMTGMFNAPLSDRVALRVAANQQKRGQYADPGFGQLDTLNARAKLLFKASDDLSVLVGAEFYRGTGYNSDGSQAQDNAGKLIGQYQAFPGYMLDKGNKGTLNIDWNLGVATLTSITAVQKFKGDENSIDAMGSMNTHFDRRDNFTQELRLASNGDNKVNWVVGAYYRDFQQRDSVNIGFAQVLPITADVPFAAPFWTGTSAPNNIITVPEVVDNQSLGLFGQATLKVTDTTRVTAGLRYSKDDIHFDQLFYWKSFLAALQPPGSCTVTSSGCLVSTLFKKTFSSTDWLARVEHDLTSNNMLYLVASTGYRPGGNGAPRTALSDAYATYDKESVKAYELGSKNRFMDNKLQLNGALYYNDYPSFQNNVSYWGPANSRATGVVSVPATIYGAELELQALLSQNDRLTASASYIHSEYKSNATSVNPFTHLSDSVLTNGKVLPHAPKIQANLGYNHTFRLGNGGNVVWDASAHYQGEQLIGFDGCYYSGSNTSLSCTGGGSTVPMWVQGNYTLVDTSLSYNSPGDKFTATVYSRNLTDQTIKTGTSGTNASLAAPRTVGVVLSAKF